MLKSYLASGAIVRKKKEKRNSLDNTFTVPSVSHVGKVRPMYSVSQVRTANVHCDYSGLALDFGSALMTSK